MIKIFLDNGTVISLTASRQAFASLKLAFSQYGSGRANKVVTIETCNGDVTINFDRVTHIVNEK